MCKLYVSFARRQPLVQRAVTGLGDRQPSQPTHARTASSEFSALRVSVSRCTECTTRVVKTYNKQRATISQQCHQYGSRWRAAGQSARSEEQAA